MISSGFFQDADAQARFAASGHADDHGMGVQVFGVVQDEIVAQLVLDRVKGFAQIESAKFFKIIHFWFL